MAYAFGRKLGPYDMPTARRIVANAARENNTFSSLVMGVVKSTPFQMRLKDKDGALAPGVSNSSVKTSQVSTAVRTGGE